MSAGKQIPVHLRERVVRGWETAHTTKEEAAQIRTFLKYGRRRYLPPAWQYRFDEAPKHWKV